MRILLDTDALLDVALNREEFVVASHGVLHWAEGQPGSTAVVWHTLSNIAYITVAPREFIRELLEFVEVAPVGTEEARQALALPMNDLEDALQASAAIAFRAAFIVTRNIRDYQKPPVRALSPAQFLSKVEIKKTH